jgi:hypothetical protein
MRVCKKLSRLLGVTLLLCVACSESHDVDRDTEGLTAGGGGDGGAGGSAKGGAGGGGGGSELDCGACAGSNIFGFALPACCTAAGKCGTDLSSFGLAACQESNAPGEVNSACPSQSIAGFLTLDGCCKPDKTCGAYDTYLGLGCVTTGEGSPSSCTP